jgi:hypothetical protein
MFIIRASNLIAIHNLALGNTTRYRLFEYTDNALKTLYGNGIMFIWNKLSLMVKIWLFENANWFYQWFFEVLRVDDLKDINGK